MVVEMFWKILYQPGIVKTLIRNFLDIYQTPKQDFNYDVKLSFPFHRTGFKTNIAMVSRTNTAGGEESLNVGQPKIINVY